MTTESIKPWEPVRGWFVAEHHDPVTHQRDRWWSFNPRNYRQLARGALPCRVTLANGQTVIVRAKQ